tara:strand:- start:444 stop:599 length:156 start_codon:yes stop_codon:yes gene_type:complete
MITKKFVHKIDDKIAASPEAAHMKECLHNLIGVAPWYAPSMALCLTDWPAD